MGCVDMASRLSFSQEQIESLKQELETMRARCERLEREKSDILLRRIAALDTVPSKTAASEVSQASVSLSFCTLL
jgi:type II secretory pathway component PulM